MKLNTHLHLAPMLRTCGAIPTLPHTFVAWCLMKHRILQYAEGQLYLYLTLFYAVIIKNLSSVGL